jgi:hypothetical protein
MNIIYIVGVAGSDGCERVIMMVGFLDVRNEIRDDHPAINNK